jgi:hypothetical protein
VLAFLGDYSEITALMHPSRNKISELGYDPKMLSRGSTQTVWLQCKGHQLVLPGGDICGEVHNWESSPHSLTKHGDVAPQCIYCTSKRGKFCLCRSVARDQRLEKEWTGRQPQNPGKVLSALGTACGTKEKFFWVCQRCNHEYVASPRDRCYGNPQRLCFKCKH